MRTPNTKCVVCCKPLYRRPHELSAVRYSACMAHRREAATAHGMTETQRAALALGRTKGTNHRAGYKHREESKLKTSQSHKKWCAENPEKVAARAKKRSGENAYNWKEGVSNLNQAIRRLNRYRVWAKNVRVRDGSCVCCGSNYRLEAHHLEELSILMTRFNIKDLTGAINCDGLFEIDNGVTLCRKCHFMVHGKIHNDNS